MGYQTYKFKLYDNARRNAFLQDRISAFAPVYNHMLALRRRYYRRYGKGLSKFKMITHLAKLKENLNLRDRVFACECGWTCDRDDNAALNIHEVGKTTFAGGRVRQVAA